MDHCKEREGKSNEKCDFSTNKRVNNGALIIFRGGLWVGS